MTASVLVIFALLAIEFCNGFEQSFLFRRRRQTFGEGLSSLLSPDFFCAVQCGVGHSTDWSKATSIAESLSSLMSGSTSTSVGTSVGKLNDTFNNLCSVYKSYSTCLESCPAGVLTNSMRQGVTALSVLCDPSRQGYVSQTPCLYNNSQMIQDQCKEANDELSAANADLQKLRQSDQVGFATKGLPAIRRLCSSADKQVRCTLPLIQQQCGSKASDLIQSILNASLTNFRQAVGDQLPHVQSSECRAFFHLMQNGMSIDFKTNNVSTFLDRTSNDWKSNFSVQIDSNSTTTNRTIEYARLKRDPKSEASSYGSGYSIVLCIAFSLVISALIR